MRLTRNQRTSPLLFQVLPLLDLLFVILIFFLLTTTFVSQPGISVNPPASSYAVEPSLRSRIVSIAGLPQPRIFFQDQVVTEKQLQAFLKNKDSESPTLIIKADRTVPYDRIMAITNLALGEGYRVVLAGTPSLDPP